MAFDGALGAFTVARYASDASFVARAEAALASTALEQGLTVTDRVLDGIPLREFDRIAVGTGPGSFTGLRIAISYAKALAFASAIPLCGVSSYDALEPEQPPVPLLVVVAGRPGIACGRLREAAGTFESCGGYHALVERLTASLSPGYIDCAGDLEGVAPHLAERGFTVRFHQPAGNPAALAIAMIAARRPAAENPHAVRAEYGELPAAEVRRHPQ